MASYIFFEYFVEIFTGNPFSGSENPDLASELRWFQHENREIAIFCHFTPKMVSEKFSGGPV